MRLLLPLCLAASLLLSCKSPAPLACPSAAPDRSARVFFATDRKRAAAPNGSEFSGERTAPPALQMGWERVTLGPKHRLGILDAAVGIAPAQLQRDTRQSGAPSSSTLYSSDAEIRAYVGTTLRSAIRSSTPAQGRRKQVLLFVHGFNNTFAYAVRKTGQLAGDLLMVDCEGRAHGVPVTYSWPSAGHLLGYLADEEMAEWTQQRLVPFVEALSAVAQQEGADLQIIAHSMGTRAVVRSLAQVALSRSHRGQLASQVILLAPDISRDLFDQYLERLLPLIGHLTIYVSSKDRALGISSILHGGHQRLGLLESTLRTALQLTGLGLAEQDRRELGEVAASAASAGKIDMIDVSGGLADFVGHSYEDREFIEDLREIIYTHTPAGTGARSNLEPREVKPDLFGFYGKRLRYFRLKTK